jgi:threonine aldolase
MSGIVDLRSDLLSRPTEAMIEAMRKAAADPPGFGLREDPWVRRLEGVAADILGKEDALFCPTCTLCNQIAINVSCAAGDSLICEAECHIVTSEGGGPAAISGVMVHAVKAEAGLLFSQAVSAALQSGGGNGRSRTALVVLENTHTRSGGRTFSEESMAEIRAMTEAVGVPVHLDGARLFNAAAHLGAEAAALTRHVDSVAISLNKGLGAPVGAVLAGERAFIEKAIAVRQRLGGGWRPAGVPAAAGVVALTEMVGRLAEDHGRAQRLGEHVRGLAGLTLISDPVETNLVLVGFSEPLGDSEAALRFLEARGIRALAYGEMLRFAVYKDVSDDDIGRIAEALGAFAETGAP